MASRDRKADDELFGLDNAITFTYRMYEARIGRFWSIDPLAAKYPWNSPYAFSENLVIDGVELEGLELEGLELVDLAVGLTNGQRSQTTDEEENILQ